MIRDFERTNYDTVHAYKLRSLPFFCLGNFFCRKYKYKCSILVVKEGSFSCKDFRILGSTDT